MIFWEDGSWKLWFFKIMVFGIMILQDYGSLKDWFFGIMLLGNYVFFGNLVLWDNGSWDRLLLGSMVRWDYGT